MNGASLSSCFSSQRTARLEIYMERIADEPYLHDRVVLDLDPGLKVGWKDVVEAAALIRKTLAAVGLRSWGEDDRRERSPHRGAGRSARLLTRVSRSRARPQTRWLNTTGGYSRPICLRRGRAKQARLDRRYF
jgi:hypothetical protein